MFEVSTTMSSQLRDLSRPPGIQVVLKRLTAIYSHLANAVEIMCEVNLVKKTCFQFVVLDCLIGLNRSSVFSI